MTDPATASAAAPASAVPASALPANAAPASSAAGPAAQVRQGDVLLVPVTAEVAAGARPLARVGGSVVLAEGEATGHAHAIRGTGAMLLEAGPDRFLRVAVPVTIDHEEHAPIPVGPGTYRVVIQREYVPPEISPVAFRRVID